MQRRVFPPPITGARTAAAVFAEIAKRAREADRLALITFRDVSVAAQYYIDSASLKFTEDPRDLDIARQQKAAADPTKLHEFHQFSKLASELRSKIWGFYALMSPRAVDLSFVDKHDPNVYINYGLNLQEVNKETHADTYLVYGYVKLQHPTITSLTYLFNPAIDILLLPHHNLITNGFATPASVAACLSASDVLTKVRAIALNSPRSAHMHWMTSLRAYTSLEVLFIIIDERFVRGNSEMDYPDRNSCRWKLHVVEKDAVLPREYGGGSGGGEYLASYKRELEDVLIGGNGGEKKECPKVLFAHYVFMHHRYGYSMDGQDQSWW